MATTTECHASSNGVQIRVDWVFKSAVFEGPFLVKRCRGREGNMKKNQTFRLGDTVRIVSGPFVSFTGKIEGINQEKALLKVKVAIYGRNKPIKLNFSEVENVSAK